MTASAFKYPCPSCNGTGQVHQWQHEDPEVGPGGLVTFDCDLCAGSKTVDAYIWHDFNPVKSPTPTINSETIRLLKQEGAIIQISGHRDGFSAGLNTGTSSNPWWEVESGWWATPQEALEALLTDPRVLPQVDL